MSLRVYRFASAHRLSVIEDRPSEYWKMYISRRDFISKQRFFYYDKKCFVKKLNKRQTIFRYIYREREREFGLNEFNSRKFKFDIFKLVKFIIIDKMMELSEIYRKNLFRNSDLLSV